jgi:plasmid stabilization system protein ParE
VHGDLNGIHEYIDHYDPNAADRLLDDFLSAFDLLSAFPYQGHRRPDLTSRPMRFKVIRDYWIAYLSDRQPLWIVAVFDGRRNPRVIAAMLRGRE